MAIDLPSGGLLNFAAFPLCGTRDNRDADGHSVQRFRRAKSKWGVSVNVAPRSAVDIAPWTDLQDDAEVFALEIPQPDLDIGNPGTPRVKGAGQGGTSLVLDGLTPGYTMRQSQWLSIIISGQRYAYRTRAPSTASGLGEITVSINPAIRVSPADNNVVEIANPKIEGYADLPAQAFDMDSSGMVRGLSFTLKERR